jgi:hypothetical protein
LFQQFNFNYHPNFSSHWLLLHVVSFPANESS